MADFHRLQYLSKLLSAKKYYEKALNNNITSCGKSNYFLLLPPTTEPSKTPTIQPTNANKSNIFRRPLTG